MTETLYGKALETTKQPSDKFDGFSATQEQITTRGGDLELDEPFLSSDIDFSAAAAHLKIHHDGNVSGSQFNRDVF